MLLSLMGWQTAVLSPIGGVRFGGAATVVVLPVLVGSGGIRFGGNAIIVATPLQYWQVPVGSALSRCADPYSPSTGERSFFE